MKRFGLLLLCMCLLLSACGTAPEETQPSTQATTQTPTTETTEATEATTVTTTEATTEATTAGTTEALNYRHPLTGERLAEPMCNRPVAVVVNNISVSQPFHGVGAADILCEHVVEGGGSITRLLAVFSDLEAAGKIGSIRSARTYMIDLARNFNAPLVHCGGSSYATQEISRSKYPDFDQFDYPAYFYRDKDRLNAGYSSEHTMMADGEDLLKGLKENNFTMTADADANYGMNFADEVTLDGEPANKITMQFYSSSGKRTIMTYDKEKDVYFGSQKWKTKQAAMLDGNTGEELSFRNVLILELKTTTNGTHMFSTMTGEGKGYYACGGTYVPIIWHRESKTDSFVYTLEDGTPLLLSPGKTYIGLLAKQSPEVIFE